MVRRITERSAVEAAMDEFDQLGRDAFLEKYGFGAALRYFILRDGRKYDSKAIYGAAHRIQFPESGEFTSEDFSGGEHAVKQPLEALGFEFSDAGVSHAGSVAHAGSITAEDIDLISSARTKKRYAELTEEERAAYVRISSNLKALGELLKSKLTNPGHFEVKTTSGFNNESGVRSYIPKDLWFSVSLRDNAKDFAGMPQFFMIVSERGIEYGFGASVSPSDFSQQSVKEIVRKAAPIVFDQFPSPESTEATKISHEVEASGGWYYRRKHRLPPSKNDFANLKEWTRYLQSVEGKKNSAGTVSRYLQGDAIGQANLEVEIAEVARVFEPLIDRTWRTSSEARDTATQNTTDFAQLLSRFLMVYGEKRTGSFGIDDELGSAMQNLKTWVEQTPAVLAMPTIKVRSSVGQGKWTKTPWIALLDSRETSSTQRGTYIVFLISEDLLVTYLTLNQGMTDLRKIHGKRGAEEEMARVGEITRPLIRNLSSASFQLDNNIDLRSDTSAAKSYEIGTIANVALPSDAIPDDATMRNYLEHLLSSYQQLIEDGQEGASVKEDDMPIVLPIAAPFTVDDALEELFLERSDIERYLDIWRSKKNLILQGAPGVGKSFLARRLAYSLIGVNDPQKVQAVQFHQSYSYEDFVQGYRPNGSLGFERKNGSFFEFRNRAVADPTGTYVFIIDEINRGNLSKILGELMLLIEPDKRDPKWAIRLSYANDGEPDFFVPSNLYILGMMNTADRSLSVVDYALRRRFAFVSMDPMFGSTKYKAHLLRYGVPADLIGKIVGGMGELNHAIETDRLNLGPGFRIGHSFFTPSETLVDAKAWYERVVENEIHPLLEEYWFDAPEKADQWRDQLL